MIRSNTRLNMLGHSCQYADKIRWAKTGMGGLKLGWAGGSSHPWLIACVCAQSLRLLPEGLTLRAFFGFVHDLYIADSATERMRKIAELQYGTTYSCGWCVTSPGAVGRALGMPCVPPISGFSNVFPNVIPQNLGVLVLNTRVMY